MQRRTRRLLEAFYTVDAELTRQLVPEVDMPWLEQLTKYTPS